MEKKSIEDKLSILDVRAELDDGTDVLIEMHLHGISQLKAKTIRSWARAYGEELEVRQSYTSQPPTITIAFADGAVEPIEPIEKSKDTKNKIHRVCMIMDKDDGTIFTDAMELHYINMKAFAKAVNEADSINIGSNNNEETETTFAKWLSIITQKEINNKTIIENAVKDKEEILMAISALQRQSEDKLIRQAYQRRKDEIYFFNKSMAEKELAEQRAEKEQRRAEQEQRRAEQAETRIELLLREIEALRTKYGES